MTSVHFNTLVLSLWGEDWQRGLDDLLRKHGHRYTRQTYYNWRKGKHPVPEPVAVVLRKQAKRKAAAGHTQPAN